MRLLLIVNLPEYFISHRLPLAQAASRAGFDVHVATGPGARSSEIEALGFVHHIVPFERGGMNPLVEVNCIWVIHRLIRRIKPALIHLVTIKPVLYGGIAARPIRDVRVVAAIAGLGSVFVASGVLAALVRELVKALFRLALGHRNLRVIFQNSDDRALLVALGAVREQQTVLIRGSGVDLSACPVLPEPGGTPVVSFAARLLTDKGVREFVEAARRLRARGISARFWLIGSIDSGNPTSVSIQQLATWRAEGAVEVLGYRTDIPALFAQSNIVVLPSYREGLPKVLIEAAACSRAVVTTNVPGCRDAIEPDKTGLLVPVRDAAALADAIKQLIENAPMRKKMGEHGRILAERAFAIDHVVNAHLTIYRELLAESG